MISKNKNIARAVTSTNNKRVKKLSETDYLLHSQPNKERLLQSVKNINSGLFTEYPLIEE
jgi:hypothetical protein